jgi:NAD+ synthase (glutamine-hydrolysing)
MKLIKCGASVLNQTALDWENNKRNIVRALQMAREEGLSVLCLPELCIPGYGCEDWFSSPEMQRMCWRVLHELLPETRDMITCLGLPLSYENRVYNTVALVVDGQIVGFVAKRNLAGDGIHYEPRWFKPWPPEVMVEFERDGATYLLGDLLFNIGGVRMGFEICEDAWVGARPGIDLARGGIDLILNPSASHFAFNKRRIRKRFVLEGSRAFGVSYVYANLVGNEAGRAIYDGDALIASAGSLLASGKRFTFQPCSLTSAVVDVELTRVKQSRIASFLPDVEHERHEIRHDFKYPQRAPEPLDTDMPEWEESPYLKEEEFTRAVSLGLFDYLRKSRSRGFIVSLSGGADSTACAVLIYLMSRFALLELGAEEFSRLLEYTGLEPEDPSDARSWTRQLLTTAYQASAHSGEVTRHASERVAQAIGATYHEMNIQNLVDEYKRIVSRAIGRELTWEDDDITLQNIQARVRGPSIWMFANIKRALLISTSNRSEAAVGYATMDGDTSGGICPIAGIDKAFLRRWLRWMEAHAPLGFEPLPELSYVNEQQPTAELRPQEAGQTDEDDLMPYELLDAIERAAIRDKKGPRDVLALMRMEFPQFEHEQLITWIKRFFRLWSYNQWKRERYAPSFHVDDKNLDPKTWCRFPILSGGYERELRELE